MAKATLASPMSNEFARVIKKEINYTLISTLYKK